MAQLSVTVALAWSFAGVHDEKPALWQLSQARLASEATAGNGVWFADLPVALTPLWQLAQLPGATPAWLKPEAGFQPLVRWQLSQLAVVGK